MVQNLYVMKLYMLWMLYQQLSQVPIQEILMIK